MLVSLVPVVPEDPLVSRPSTFPGTIGRTVVQTCAGFQAPGSTHRKSGPPGPILASLHRASPANSPGSASFLPLAIFLTILTSGTTPLYVGTGPLSSTLAGGHCSVIFRIQNNEDLRLVHISLLYNSISLVYTHAVIILLNA